MSHTKIALLYFDCIKRSLYHSSEMRMRSEDAGGYRESNKYIKDEDDPYGHSFHRNTDEEGHRDEAGESLDLSLVEVISSANKNFTP